MRYSNATVNIECVLRVIRNKVMEVGEEVRSRNEVSKKWSINVGKSDRENNARDYPCNKILQ